MNDRPIKHIYLKRLTSSLNTSLKTPKPNSTNNNATIQTAILPSLFITNNSTTLTKENHEQYHTIPVLKKHSVKPLLT